MLRSTNSSIWFPALVLQQGPNFVPHENPQQDAEKSRHLDLRGIQNFAFGRHRSHHWYHTYKIPPPKNR